jgi:hypothetical protein
MVLVVHGENFGPPASVRSWAPSLHAPCLVVPMMLMLLHVSLAVLVPVLVPVELLLDVR